MQISLNTFKDETDIDDHIKIWRIKVGQILLYTKYKSLSELERDWDEFNLMHYDDQMESDLKSVELANDTNLNRYIKMRSEFLKEDIEDSLDTSYIPIGNRINESTNPFNFILEDSVVDASDTIYVEPEVPFFTPDEMIKLGITYVSKGRYSDNPDVTTIYEKKVKSWFKEYCNKFSGFTNEGYIPSFEWERVIKGMCSDLDSLSGVELLDRKQSILDLGWNPEIPYNEKTKKYARNRITSMMESAKVIQYNRKINIAETSIPSPSYIDIALFDKKNNGYFSKIGLVHPNGKKIKYYNTSSNDVDTHIVTGNESVSYMRCNVTEDTMMKIRKNPNKFTFAIPENTYIVSPSIVINSFIESVLKSVRMYTDMKKELYLMNEITISESGIDNSVFMPILEVKELPIEFDDDGNLLISKGKDIDFEGEYSRCHLAMKQYAKTNAINGMKYSVIKLWYMNIMLEEAIHSTKSREKLKAYHKVRAKIIGDIKIYVPVILKLDPNFDILKEYNNSPFANNKLKIKRSTIKYTIDLFKRLISFF